MSNICDLENFRKTWLQELKEHDNGSSISAETHVHGACTKNPDASIQNQQIGLYDAKQNPSVYDNADVDSDAESLSSQNACVSRHQISNHESCGNESVDDLEETLNSASSYYPFRVLSNLMSHKISEDVHKNTKRTASFALAFPSSKNNNYFPVATEGVKKLKRGVCNFSTEMKISDKGDSSKKKERYLDLFIADLDEISEIPFFDISLPREVAIKIFWHLDIQDLCRCAQVSKSWKSLAEDELLWCHICHRLGFEKNRVTVEHTNWKSLVSHFTVLKQKLELNWKGRIGKLHNLQHARGGVLCAAKLYKSTIIAGFSNCQTKMWDLMSRETCIFKPSSTALVINEDSDEGTIANEVLHVDSCQRITAASYLHGFVDVWSNEEGTEPTYSFGIPGSKPFSALKLCETQHEVYLAVARDTELQLHKVENGQGYLTDRSGLVSQVNSIVWIRPPNCSAPIDCTPTMAVSTGNAVSVYSVCSQKLASNLVGTEIHNIIDAPVKCIDTRFEPCQLFVGFSLHTGTAQMFKANVYNILTRQILLSLIGHTSSVTCVNMADSPPFQLVTGSLDRKVRVYDMRVASSAMVTLIGHSASVTVVQMDDLKVVSGDEGGFVCVWDQRMGTKLWEMHSRHPVQYCKFDDRFLVVGHMPSIKHHYYENEFDTGLHQRHRGCLHVYDFLADQTTQGVPEICLSSYDEPQGYNYNIALAVPYDIV